MNSNRAPSAHRTLNPDSILYIGEARRANGGKRRLTRPERGSAQTLGVLLSRGCFCVGLELGPNRRRPIGARLL